MRITNRSVLSLAFLLAAGALVAFGMMGCQPESTGGSTTPPPKPNVDLPDAPATPKPVSPSADATEPPAAPAEEEEVPPVDPKKTLFGVTVPEAGPETITVASGEDVEVRGYFATDWKPIFSARFDGMNWGVRTVESEQISSTYPDYTNKGVWMLTVPAKFITSEGGELVVSFRNQERYKATIIAE